MRVIEARTAVCLDRRAGRALDREQPDRDHPGNLLRRAYGTPRSVHGIPAHTG